MDAEEDTFFNALQQAHGPCPAGERLSLTDPSDPADWERAGALRFEDGHIVEVDVTRLAQGYLVWESRGLERLPHLRRLILGNTRLDELDLSSCGALTEVVLAEGADDPLVLYLAECPALSRLDVSRYRGRDDRRATTVCARAEQVGTVIPADLEARSRTGDGFLTLELALTPPGHPSVESRALPLRYLVRHEQADLAQVLDGYWSLRPEYYTRYATLDDARPTERDDFALVLSIEDRVARGIFSARGGRFDPDDYHGERLRDRPVDPGRPIPDCMFQRVGPQ